MYLFLSLLLLDASLLPSCRRLQSKWQSSSRIWKSLLLNTEKKSRRIHPFGINFMQCVRNWAWIHCSVCSFARSLSSLLSIFRWYLFLLQHKKVSGQNFLASATFIMSSRFKLSTFALQQDHKFALLFSIFFYRDSIVLIFSLCAQNGGLIAFPDLLRRVTLMRGSFANPIAE